MQLETHLALITLYDSEKKEKEEMNRFMQDLSSLNAFYKKPTNENVDTDDSASSSEDDKIKYDNNEGTSGKELKSIDDRIRRIGRKKITTYKKQLKAFKNRHTNAKETADDSIHAKPKKPLLTYDAYIPTYKINRGSDADEKKHILN